MFIYSSQLQSGMTYSLAQTNTAFLSNVKEGNDASKDSS